MTFSKISHAAKSTLTNNRLIPSATKIIQRAISSKGADFELAQKYINAAIDKQNAAKEKTKEKSPQEKLQAHIKQQVKNKEAELIKNGYEILDAKKAGRQWEAILTDAYKMQQEDQNYLNLEGMDKHYKKDSNSNKTANERLDQLEQKVRHLEIEKTKSKFNEVDSIDTNYRINSFQDRLFRQEKRITKLERKSFAQQRNLEFAIEECKSKHPQNIQKYSGEAEGRCTNQTDNANSKRGR